MCNDVCNSVSRAFVTQARPSPAQPSPPSPAPLSLQTRVAGFSSWRWVTYRARSADAMMALRARWSA